MSGHARRIQRFIHRQTLGNFLLILYMVLAANGANQPSKEQEPDPLDLLKTVAQARQHVTSGEMEFQVTSHEFSRPQDGTNQIRLKVVFDDQKRRFESFGREYRYVLMGPDAARVTDAKMVELGLDREAAVRAGLLESFEARDVTAYDGTALLKYRETDGKPENTIIDDPRKGSSTYVFDPRCIGLRTSLSVNNTVENALGYDGAKSISLVGKESIEGTASWHVQVKSKYEESLDFWIDAARRERVIKHAYGPHVVLSKFDEAHPKDPIPTEVKIMEQRGGKPFLGKRFTRTKAPVDPSAWTLAGLNMRVGTEVIDSRIHRKIGYWNGTGLSKDFPSITTQQNTKPMREPSPDKLLALVEKDSKSAFALEAAAWIILNTPDGPEVERAAEVILREHTRSTNLVYLCQGLVRLRHRCAKSLLQSVLQNNPNVEVQAHACFALATLLKSQANETADERTANDAGLLFERVIVDFSQVDSEGEKLAELAKPELSELRRLGVGKVAPEIEGEDLNGRKMNLSSQRGKVVVLTFWGAWCGPCMQMVPEERKLVERMAGKPFALIGINSDTDDAKLKAAVEKEKIIWPSFRDGGAPGPIAAAWNVRSWPTVYVLDPKGIIRYRNVHGQALAEAVDTLIREGK